MVNNPIFKFEDAERLQCKASIMIEGLPGQGKSGLALTMGYILAGEDWSKVAAIDTENKSLNLFAGLNASIGVPFGKFKVGQLTPEIGFKPSNYIAFRELAIQNGAKAIIEDSISHAWMYKGGVLDLVNKAKTKSAHYAKDKYAAWGDEEVVAEKNELLQLIRDPKAHIISTVRVKEKFEYTVEDGKNKLSSLGEQQIMQEDLKYEPDLVLHMLSPGMNKNGEIKHPIVRCVKTRYAIFTKDMEYEMTPNLIKQLKDYLESGADPNQLLEQQRAEYVEAVKAYLDSHQSAVPIWTVLKKDAGFEKTKLEEIPLETLKQLYLKLTN